MKIKFIGVLPTLFLPTFLCLLLTFFLPTFSFAHGEPEQKNSAGAKNYFTLSKSTDQFELVLRYKEIAPGKSTGLTVFLSDYLTNKAIDSAKISVSSPDDANLKFEITQTDKGQYDVDATFPQQKRYALTFTISAGGKNDLILISPVEVGKKLAIPEEAVGSNQYAVGSWWSLLFAFGIGLLLMYFLMKSRMNKTSRAQKVVTVFLLTACCLLPTDFTEQAWAHGDPTFSGGGGAKDEFEVGKETQFLFTVLTAKPTYSDYSTQLQLNGVVKPATNGYAQIVSPQNGTIESLNVSIGQQVSKGQILAVIEQTQSSAEQVSLATERANANAEYEAAKKEYDRLQSLKDIVSQKDLQNAEIRYNNAVQNKQVYAKLSGNFSLRYEVRSPLNGTLDNFNLATGQQVEQGETMMNVYNTSVVNVEATVFADDVSKIAGDQLFSVFLNDQSPSIPAKMISLNNSFNPINQSATLVLQVNNSENILLPGQAVHILVLKKASKPQMVVSGSAIAYMNGKPAVFVHHVPEEFKIIYVQIGAANASGTEIMSGLTDDDRVVVSGTYEVKSIFQNQ